MSQPQISALAQVISIIMGLCATSAAQTPGWVSFPGEKWKSITPEDAGLDETKFNAWVASQEPKYGVAYGGQQPERGGAVITRGGYILHTCGDPGFKFQSVRIECAFIPPGGADRKHTCDELADVPPSARTLTFAPPRLILGR